MFSSEITGPVKVKSHGDPPLEGEKLCKIYLETLETQRFTSTVSFTGLT